MPKNQSLQYTEPSTKALTLFRLNTKFTTFLDNHSNALWRGQYHYNVLVERRMWDILPYDFLWSEVWKCYIHGYTYNYYQVCIYNSFTPQIKGSYRGLNFINHLHNTAFQVYYSFLECWYFRWHMLPTRLYTNYLEY